MCCVCMHVWVRVCISTSIKSISFLHGGWSQSDAARFAFVMEQYTSSAPGQRALRMDRLLRELPHKTRNDIVRFLVAYCSYLFTGVNLFM